MAFNFRKSVKIAPGVRLNVGKKSASISAGVRGARITKGTRGTTTTVGIPGTGLSHTTHTPNKKKAPTKSATRQPPTKLFEQNEVEPMPKEGLE